MLNNLRFRKAILNKNIKEILVLLECNVSPNSQDEDGWTLLHWACSYGNLEITKILIENNADITIRNNYNWTCVHEATYYKNNDILAYLIEKAEEFNIDIKTLL